MNRPRRFLYDLVVSPGSVRNRGRWLISKVLSSPVPARTISVLDSLLTGRSNVLAVLTYHRVDVPTARPYLDPGPISADPAGFEEQMRYLASQRRVLSLQDLMDAQQTGRELPRRSVMITFDDAYEDFAQHAWPVLRRLSLPVTLFVPTAYPGDPTRSFWWDRLYHAIQVTRSSRVRADEIQGSVPLRTAGERARAYALLARRVKSLPHGDAMDFIERIMDQLDVAPARGAVLDWSALRRLADEGVTLASHSRTHPLLSRVTSDQLDDELKGSVADLEREVGVATGAVAYPDGAHSAEVLASARQAKLSIGFTVVRGVNDLRGIDWLRLRRIHVGSNSPLPVLRAQLLTYSGRRAGRASQSKLASSELARRYRHQRG